MSRILLLAGLLVLSAAPALAQQAARAPAPAAAPAAGQPLGGPQIAGVCLLSQAAVVANAKVGVAASARLKQLTDQAQAEVAADRASIEADAKQIDPLPAGADKTAKTQALSVRLQALQTKANLLNREIEATRVKALDRVAAQEQPIIAQAYTAHKCGLLFDRTSVLGGNMGGDLTADVVKGLDARMATITFDRETLAK
jgi:Skp family chaperone for outer membrane proteins